MMINDIATTNKIVIILFIKLKLISECLFLDKQKAKRMPKQAGEAQANFAKGSNAARTSILRRPKDYSPVGHRKPE
jgi:hypothetical protein